MGQFTRKVRKLFRHPILFAKESHLFTEKKIPISGQLPEEIDPETGIDFVVYFSGKMSLFYQIAQWLPAFEKLAEQNSFMFVVRKQSVFRELAHNTNLPVCYCQSLNDLMDLYDANNIRSVIYVNNAVKNFQSLIDHRSLHVHINHGESEKSSMYSNQSKAYDYVFVVSDAGFNRYKDNLIKMDESKYISVGRPQLDGIVPIEINNPTNKPVVLYAPTWAATHTAMDYASVAEFGSDITEAFINNDDYYFIYRPHPSIGVTSKEEKHEDHIIKRAIKKSASAEIIMDVDINRIFPVTDIAIFDNSSVAIDYLSLNKPMIMTDYFHKNPDLAELPPIAEACRLVPSEEASQIEAIVAQELADDTKTADRAKVKTSYLGNYAEGESTDLFVSTLQKIIAERAHLISS